MIDRVEAHTGDAPDADAGVVRQQLGYEMGHISWVKINASGKVEEVKARALERV